MEQSTPIPQIVITSGSGFWIRFLARFIDLLLGFILAPVGVILGAIVLAIGQDAGAVSPGWQHRVGGLSVRAMGLSLLGGFLYHCCTEGVHGASLGKLICRLRVITIDGRPCNLMRAIQRSLAYYWDALFFGLVGYNSMQQSPLNQRYGDVWAKTVVVRAATVPRSAVRPGWVFLLGFVPGATCWLFMLALGLILKAR